MGIKRVVSELELSAPKEESGRIAEETKKIVALLKKEVIKSGTGAEIFVGGSFAKGTLIKSDFYDVDIFARFGWKYENISEILDKIAKNVAKKSKLKLEKIHGSRDYFRIISKNIIFEIVPVTKIKKPREARNVTDLSYFHVNYVRRNLKKNLKKEVIFAKQFCKAQKIYGAESYVNGFSGYALECLIIYYKSFEKMLRELAKVKERLVIDPEKSYKNKSDILFEMNESKLNGPIVLVDPTWKERNVLAALSWETFRKFQEAARNFLKKPSKSFFEIKKFDANEFKKKAGKGEFVLIRIETGKQPGDIAGTKLRKFSNYILRELSRYFKINSSEFDYTGEQTANLYIAAKPKKEIIKIGPPSDFTKHAKEFKKQNKKVYEKNGILYAKIKVDFTAKKFLNEFAGDYKKIIEGMGITGFSVS